MIGLKENKTREFKQDYSASFGLSGSGVKKILTKLKNKGFIEAKGKSRATIYLLSKKH